MKEKRILKPMNQMQQIILTKGLPASGKSTFAKAWVLEDPKTRIRVNRDDIRRMLGPYWVPSREVLVTLIEKQCIFSALEQKYSVIVDATNFKPPVTKELADIYNCEWIIKDFTDVPIETCIERDKNRPKEEQVGEEVIRNMALKYKII
jgi:predicted kinase